MNSSLALYVDPEYIAAGVEPYEGKFQLISRRGIKIFPLYFFIDELNNKIDYSIVYKKDFEEGKANYFGNFFDQITDPSKIYKWYKYDSEIINLSLTILDDIKSAYFYIMKSFEEQGQFDESAPIPVNICFSDNISSKAMNFFCDFINKQNYLIKSNKITMPQLATNYVMDQKRLEFKDKKFAILEALGEHLNISVVSIYSEYDKERTNFKSYPSYGIDPRIQVIAQKIVDDINKAEGLLSNSESLKEEYKRHFKLAEELVFKLESERKPYILVETSFKIDLSRKLQTTLSIDEIEHLTSFHIRQISKFFADYFLPENSLKLDQIDHIILFGNTLNNELVKKEMNRFGSNKLIYFTSDDISILVNELTRFGQVKVKKSNVVEELAPVHQVQTTYKSVPYITISALITGNIIKVDTFDPNPGKGAAMKEIEYLGEKKFKVISCTRGLQVSDIITAITPVWTAGIQIDFLVERNGKAMGQYRTRKIAKLELK